MCVRVCVRERETYTQRVCVHVCVCETETVCARGRLREKKTERKRKKERQDDRTSAIEGTIHRGKGRVCVCHQTQTERKTDRQAG